MRRLGFLLFAGVFAALAGCATLEGPPPLTGADIVARVREGKSAQEIIEELRRTHTVLALQGSDIVALHGAGVPDEVLNYLQLALIEEIRWREYVQRSMWGHPWYRGFGPCPWPPRYYRGSPWWGC
jgi:hypothetical protein